MGRLISLAECWGLCSQRKVVLNTIYCRGQHICCWFSYLRYFLLFILEACLSLVICSPLFTTGLLWRKCPINCGFGGMYYHIRVPRVSRHVRLCGRVWGLQASSFKSLPSAKCTALSIACLHAIKRKRHRERFRETVRKTEFMCFVCTKPRNVTK